MSEKFVKETQETLEKCAVWLYAHAYVLANQIYGGCTHWEVRFSAGNDGLFPNVAITTTKIDSETMRLTYGALEGDEMDSIIANDVKTKIEESEFVLKTVKKDSE